MKTQNPTPQMQMEVFSGECRKRGLSVTPQRIAVYREVISTESHPTAEEIHGKIQRVLPSISLATVYKTLETFEKYGFISKTRSTGEKARYDGNQSAHHHLVCRECGKIEDCYDKVYEKLPLPTGTGSGFEIEEFQIDFRGVCGKCRHKKSSLKKTNNKN